MRPCTSLRGLIRYAFSCAYLSLNEEEAETFFHRLNGNYRVPHGADSDVVTWTMDDRRGFELSLVIPGEADYQSTFVIDTHHVSDVGVTQLKVHGLWACDEPDAQPGGQLPRH